MINNNSIYKTILLCLFVCVATAQDKNKDVVTILKRASEKLKSEAYFSYNVKYNMYKDYTSDALQESYSGLLLKSGNTYYFKIKNTEFVSFKDYAVKVSKDEKAILISREQKQQFPMDIANYLQGFDYKFLGNSTTTYICELVPVKVSQIMFSKVILYINKKDYSIMRQTLYFLNTTENKKGTAKPRLDIIFSPREKNAAKDNFLINEKSYFIRTAGDIKLASRFKAYQLFKV